MPQAGLAATGLRWCSRASRARWVHALLFVHFIYFFNCCPEIKRREQPARALPPLLRGAPLCEPSGSPSPRRGRPRLSCACPCSSSREGGGGRCSWKSPAWGVGHILGRDSMTEADTNKQRGGGGGGVREAEPARISSALRHSQSLLERGAGRMCALLPRLPTAR